MTAYFLLNLIFLFVVGPSHSSEKERWLVQKSSKLAIEGKSNVNDFVCEISGNNQTDTLTIDYDEDGGEIFFLKKKVRIGTSTFDCGNSLITQDFRETLKSDQYPFITLNFLTLDRPQFKDFSAMNVHGTVEIIIADIPREYTITYQIIPHTSGMIELNGSQTIQIKDFNLTPPTHLLGLIKVEERIKVDFNLQLTPLL